MVEFIDNFFILYIILLGDRKMYREDQKLELKLELTKDIKKEIVCNIW